MQSFNIKENSCPNCFSSCFVFFLLPSTGKSVTLPHNPADDSQVH